MATITDSIGRVLSGRYRIESAVGAGASARVFAAWDVALKRRVALKVLHPALAEDPAFLRRLRAEAQAAAALNHPNVVAVFDWGEDAAAPYLVMAFLGGGSVREMLDAGARLTVAQATAVGVQAAEGLAYAHARGVVHRDVKPANLLFDDEGRLAIADFGLARALAEAAWTEPAGATLGTARYASPEQAEGRMVDGRSDVYGLALVLYETVTATVPFAADTTVATLMARIAATLPDDDRLGPLGPVLSSAAAPNVDDRPDARAFAQALQAVADTLPAAEPLPLARTRRPPGPAEGSAPPGPEAAELGRDDMVEGDDGRDDRTLAVAATPRRSRGRAGSPTSDVAGAAGTRPRGDDTLALAAAVGVADHVAGLLGSDVLETRETRRRHRRVWFWVMGVLLVALAGGGLAWGAVRTGVFVARHKVPAITGLSESAANAGLRPKHLVLHVLRTRSSTTVPSGSVLRQIPGAGTRLKEGSTVDVVLSSGPPPVALPNTALGAIAGASPCDAARQVLQAGGLVLGSCTGQSSTTVASGKLIDWSPHRASVPLGSSVAVVYSTGPPMVALPSLAGISTCTGVTSAFNAAGLAVSCTSATSTSVAAGGVVSETPSGQAPLGSSVAVVLSTGPPMVEVPAIPAGGGLETTVNALEAAGFVVGNVYGPAGGAVFATNPSNPSSAPEGSSVDIYRK